MGKSSKTNKRPVRQTAKAVPNRDTVVRTAPVKKPSQPLWMRIGIGMAAVAMIGWTVSQFVPTPGSVTPIVPLASAPTVTPSDVPLVPVPADQVGKPVNQPIPTIRAGAGSSSPTDLAGLPRTSFTQGTQVLTDINKLHGTDTTLSDGYNAVYSWLNLKMTVTVGVGGGSDNAAALVKQMQDTISKGGTSFTDVKPLAVGGLNIFQVNGPGGSNYFYQSVSNVVWLTIQAPDTDTVNKLLWEALQTF